MSNITIRKMHKSLLPNSIRFYEITYKFETAEELLVVIACAVLKKFHDRSLVNRLIDLKHTELFSNPEATKILKGEINPTKQIGHFQKKRGRKPNTPIQQSRIRSIGHMAWYYHFMGAPKRNNQDLSKTKSACTIVSELCFCSESKVWQAMRKYYSHPMKCLAASDKLNKINRVFDQQSSFRVNGKINTLFEAKYYRDFETIIELLQLR